MVTVGTRIDGNQGVLEDSEELVDALDAKVKDCLLYTSDAADDC